MNIEEKIKKVIDRQLHKGERNINDLSRIGLTHADYAEFLAHGNEFDENFDISSPIYMGVPVFKSNSDGGSRAFFKFRDISKSIGIIGTAGRGSDKERMGPYYWNLMLESSVKLIEHTASNILVSGGAAWADQIAVSIYLKNTEMFSLTLHLPCDFINGEFDSNNQYGTTANHYHRACSEKLGVDTLKQIDSAIKSGCEVTVSKNGFIERNGKVSDSSNSLLAFTFGDREILKDGGTKHTFDTFLKKEIRGLAFHYNLNDEKIFTF